MKLKRIKLRGFKGIRRGLGVNEIDVDLSGLRGVVAIVGPNGKGKTTFLECLQPYRTMPSRKLSLKDSVYARDSYKELTFVMGNEEFRSLVTVDVVNGKSDGFLWSGERSLTSGKVSEHDEVLEEILGSQDLFFHSVFSPQAFESILSLRPAVRKQFFVEFLGIEKLQEYSDSAKRIAAAFAPSLLVLTQEEQKLREKIEGIPGAVEFVEYQRGRLTELEEVLVRTRESKEVLSIQYSELQLKVTESKAAEETLRYWRERSGEFDRELLSRKKVFEDEANKLGAQIEKARVVVRQVDAELAEIRAIGSPESWQGELDATDQDLVTVDEQLRAIDEFRVTERDMRNEIVAVKRTEVEIIATLESTKRMKSAISERPEDAPDSLCRRCGLLKGAWKARDEEELLQTRLEQARQKISQREIQLEMEKPEGFDNAFVLTGNARNLRTQIKALQMKLRVSAGMPGLIAVKQDKVDSIANMEESKQEFEERLGAIEIESRNGKINIEDEIVRAKATIIEGIDADIKDSKEGLTVIDARIEFQQNGVARMSAEIEVREREIAELRNREGELSRISDEIRGKVSDQREWAFLSQLCGRDKLQGLELDAAAPAVTRYGNLLLGECFGGRFSMSFRTLDEDGREVFDLIVNDTMADDNEINIALLSGGEKLIVLHALRLSLMLYMKERSSRNFQTVFADELDGALYAESRREFVAVNREAMKIGGIDTFFLITHSEEVSEQADHVISFGDGGIEIR